MTRIRTRYFRWAFWFLLGVVTAWALVSCDEPQTGGSIIPPPERYQGNGMAIIITADRHEIAHVRGWAANHPE